jgi:hypothetical protein
VGGGERGLGGRKGEEGAKGCDGSEGALEERRKRGGGERVYPGLPLSIGRCGLSDLFSD